MNALGKTDEGVTALYLAVSRENKEAVKQLLSLGADPNQPSDGSLCLQCAINNGDLKMASMLIEAGAEVNGYIRHQPSALMGACASGNWEFIDFLLKHGAEVNLWVPEEGDALQAAAREGYEEVVKRLLELGANPRAREGRGGSCLECAISSRNMRVVHLLLDAGALVNYSGTRADIEEFNGGFGSPLSASLWNKQDGLTRLLLEGGADPNWPGRPWYGSALEEAICRDDEEAVDLLLRHGADINLVAGYTGSALMYAITAEKNADKYTRLLLKSGANVNLFAGKEYGTALMVSSRPFPLGLDDRA